MRGRAALAGVPPAEAPSAWLVAEAECCGLPGPQDNKKMKKSLEEEQRARRDLEKLVRKVLKTLNDPAWDETNL